VVDDAEVTQVAQRLAGMLGPGDLEETLRGITAAAVEVLPDVDYASITVRHADGRLQTSAPTATMLRGLDATQYDLHEGPCYESVTDTVHLTAPHLAEDERFPRYRDAAVGAGIQAQAGIRLFESDHSIGALNLYSRRAGAFQDLGFLGVLFAHHSAVALQYAQEVENLRDAIVVRQLVGQAVGISMERYEFTDEQAFAFLTRLSQYTGSSLRDVAQAVVDAGRARAEPT
jgi:GAF domain-containing protein